MRSKYCAIGCLQDFLCDQAVLQAVYNICLMLKIVYNICFMLKLV